MMKKVLIAVKDEISGWHMYSADNPYVTITSSIESCGIESRVVGEINIEYNGLKPICGIERAKLFDTYGGKQAYTALQQAINNDILYGVYPHNPYITKVIFNGPATIVFFKDGGKEVVKCKNMSWRYNPEIGILYAVLKHTCDKKTYDNNLRVIDEMIGGDK